MRYFFQSKHGDYLQLKLVHQDQDFLFKDEGYRLFNGGVDWIGNCYERAFPLAHDFPTVITSSKQYNFLSNNHINFADVDLRHGLN